MPRKKDCLEKYGIYPEAYDEFFKLVKKKFEKRKDLISQTRIRNETGKNAETIKKYLNAGVELGDIRPCEAYFIGCSPYELIITNFGQGDAIICPKCNKEVLPPIEGNEVVCNCGIHYSKQDASRWIYQPRLEYLGTDSWRLESLSVPGDFYSVRPFDGYCSCAHHRYRGAYCKHLKNVVELFAQTMCFEKNLNANFKSGEGLAVITAVLRRWFDPRRRSKPLTYRELSNEVEKISGLKLSRNRLAQIVAKFEEKQVLKRENRSLLGFEGKTLVALNPSVISEFNNLSKQIGDSLTVKVDLSEEKMPFLKLDRVDNPRMMLPNAEFSMEVYVNYNLPEPTDIRLEVRDAESHMTSCCVTVHLNGEDVRCIRLYPKPFDKKMWIPQVELYSMNDKNEWCLSDYYLTGQRVFSPIIKANENKEGFYQVESFSEQGKFYDVDFLRKQCTCPDHMYNQKYCKHLQTIEKIQSQQSKIEPKFRG